MHGVDDDKLPEAQMRQLAILQRARDDADRGAAAGQHRVGDRPHQPVAAAAIDKLDARSGEPGAERSRCLALTRIAANRGAEIAAQPPVPSRHEIAFHCCERSSSSEPGPIASGLGGAYTPAASE